MIHWENHWKKNLTKKSYNIYKHNFFLGGIDLLKKNDVQQKDFFQDFDLLIVNIQSPIQFMKNVWL